MKFKKKINIPEIEGISLSELFPGIEIEENFRISTAQAFLEAQIEEMHEAIRCDTIGDTSIITVNGEIYIYAKWDKNGVDLDFRNEGFPALGLMGAILATVNYVRGHDGEEEEESIDEV